MIQLERLARKHGTDKQGDHSYVQHYARHLQPFRRRPIRLLEIGIGGYQEPTAGGPSLRMWKDYFPLGTIVGLDIVDKSALAQDRIHIEVGSQDDPAVIERLARSYGGFDIVIDDGSHVNAHVLRSFELLFPAVTTGGLYVIEDLQTSYWPGLGGSSTDLNRAGTSIAFLKSLLDNLHQAEIVRPGYTPSYLDLNVFGLHVYHNIAFIQKGDNSEPSNIIVNYDVPDGHRDFVLGSNDAPAAPPPRRRTRKRAP